MRAVIFVCVCTLSVVTGQDRGSVPSYDSRYDYLDVDDILNSKRLVKNYVDCLVNVKPCTPEGKALKRILPEALRTKCARCTEKQKRTAVKVIKRLKEDHPEEWAKVASRWDPTGDFTRFFEDYLAKDQSNTITDTGNEIVGFPVITPTTAPSLSTQAPTSTSSAQPKPIILNRFGDEGESTTKKATTVRPTPPVPDPEPEPNMRPTTIRTRPPLMIWTGAASDQMPTRFPLRPSSELPIPFSTTITLIDQIGYKIIRTTELVTDILKNTVRAVVGR